MKEHSKEHSIVARYHASGTWRAGAGLHAGGEASFDSNTDMALLRDSEGRFFIPGASIAGAARSFLARLETDFRSYIGGIKKESPNIQLLFGSGRMSLLTVFDAPCEGMPMPRVRDGVRIDGAKGVAVEGAKYDFEVLPAGTEFGMQFLFIVYHDTPDEVLRFFHSMLAGFQEGGICLGARTRRGLGHGAFTKLEIRKLDMSNLVHVRSWLAQEWSMGEKVELKPPQRKALNRLTIEACLRLKTSLLIRSAGEEAGAPDMVHLSEEGCQLLAGTSLAGALRHRCERIANTMCPDSAEKLVASMFGPLEKKGDNKPLRAGRIWIGEEKLQKGELLVQSRVKIDRFTGGAVESALFDQAPFWPNDADYHVKISIHLDLDCAPEMLPESEEEPLPPADPRECALILQAFKDLWLGDLPLGGEIGGGRGVFYGVRASFSQPGLETLQFRANAGNPEHIEIKGNWESWNEAASALHSKQVPHA